MEYKIGRSSNQQIEGAIREATLGLREPKLIMFFSDVEHFEAYTSELKKAFPESMIMGATTFVGLCKEGAFKETLLVLGFETGIECYGNVLEEVDKYPLKYVKRVEQCVNAVVNTNNTMCFTLTTALISCEELVLSTLNSVLMKKDIPLFGGSAGDKGRAERTMVSFNGKVYERACVFVILKNLGGKIKFYQENIYKQTSHHFTATKVDVRNRIVYEYDGKPAALEVAKALGTDIKHLPSYLDSYPMGRLIGKDMYITANKEITPHNGMAYHARVYKNAQMVLLEPDAYKVVIEKTIEKIKNEVPNPALTLVVHCLARSILFEQDGYLDSFAKQMGRAFGNYIGFGGYGEQLRQQHFNQTMIIAVFE